MRKVIILLCSLFLLPVVAKAEIPAWEWKPKYMGEMHLGYGTTADLMGRDAYVGRVMLGTLQGAQINEYLSIAAGIDAVMMTHYYKGQDLRFAMNTYIDMRGYYPVTDKFSPFLDLAFGCGLDVHPWDSNNRPYFLCQFGPGLKYRKFVLSCGLQQLGVGDTGFSTFYVKVGLRF